MIVKYLMKSYFWRIDREEIGRRYENWKEVCEIGYGFLKGGSFEGIILGNEKFK